jgi:serine protease Do
MLLGVGTIELWSSSGGGKALSQSGAAVSAQAAASEAEGLQGAFVRIAEEVGPAVVSISTEQIERVRQYFRVHPFFGDAPMFEEFFRQFYGDVPQQEFRRFGLGSGVLIDQRGYILTNEHVVSDAEKITVTLADGRDFVGTVKGKDPRSDLAVIQIDANGLPAARLGDSNAVKAGQWAIALGNPFGLVGAGPAVRAVGAQPSLTVGVVSALDRQLPRASQQDRDYTGLIQTDAAINPGNSGGPLLNLQGEIIGINVAILTSSRGFEGIGFAIPVNKAKRVLATLIDGKRVIYGWLGIQIQDITDDVAEYYGLGKQQGVLVYQVLPDGPAAGAGIQDGDIIKTVEGRPIRYARELIDLVSGSPIGTRVRVEVLRTGETRTLQVAIGERPGEMGEAGGEAAQRWRGLMVGSLSDEQAERFELPPGMAGVVVLEVEPGSPAEQAGLRTGDVINEINRVRIEGVSPYHRVVARITGNALVRTNRGYVVIKAGG